VRSDGGDFDERFDAVEVTDALHAGADRRLVTLGERGVDLVRALGPDGSTAALGLFLEVSAAPFERRDDRLVLKEQTLDGLTGGRPTDRFADFDPNLLTGLGFDGHNTVSNIH